MSGEKRQVLVQPFGIQIDHRRNAPVLLQGIPGRQLMRSAISASKPGYGPDAGISAAQMSKFGKLPNTPGMEIHVNPASLSYVIRDPLTEDKELCEKIETKLKQDGRPLPGKLSGHPTLKGTLSEDRMKTLCRELLWLLDEGDAKMVKGPKPSMGDVEALPGKFLLNPGSTIKTSQPQYEEDLPEWSSRLDRIGA